MIKNVYIHIPFCKSKCNYCSFISFESLELIDLYFNTLAEEIKLSYKLEKLKTLYFGGGTPSVISIGKLKGIINLFNLDSETEVTIECNPNDVNDDYLKGLIETGFNRLSIGTQSFNDEILKQIGRRHTSEEAIKVVKQAKKMGFENISVDLIYGLPNQSLSDFKNDLTQILELDIQHVSFYGLKIEEGCKFSLNMPKNLPDLDMQAEMYEFGCDFLKENGFIHYEISNFGKDGFYSKHNLNYWDNNSYYGFGVGAHGFDGEFRYSNLISIEEYLKNPLKKHQIDKISKQQSLEEEIFLGFRKQSGIEINRINEKFSMDFERKYKNILQKYSEFLIKTDGRYALSEKGFLISNEILCEFIE